MMCKTKFACWSIRFIVKIVELIDPDLDELLQLKQKLTMLEHINDNNLYTQEAEYLLYRIYMHAVDLNDQDTSNTITKMIDIFDNGKGICEYLQDDHTIIKEHTRIVLIICSIYKFNISIPGNAYRMISTMINAYKRCVEITDEPLIQDNIIEWVEKWLGDHQPMVKSSTKQ